MLIVLAAIGLLAWGLESAYKAGGRDAEGEHRCEEAEALTPDWSTYVGDIEGVTEGGISVMLLCSLDVSGGPAGFASGESLGRALADTFPGGAWRGKGIVYTVSGSALPLLKGFTPTEEWTGPEIPLQGIHEKGAAVLLSRHKNQVIEADLRRPLEIHSAYKSVRFY